MKTLKKQISHYMYMITFVLIVFIILTLLCIQIFTEQNRAYNDATRTIKQIESVLEENQKDAKEIEEAYRQTCIHNAEIVARVIENDPDILNDTDELIRIALSAEVDEIHLFDETGRIFAGTHPQYFDYTFDSGEQIQFFKPMLEDKSLQLIQDITPNTAEGKPMQYAAVWCGNGEYIVQVGMDPVHVMKATEKNELSHIFYHFRVNPDADYYAINIENGVIIGSTNLETVGLQISDIGIDISKIRNDKDGFHTKVNNHLSFCVFEQSKDNYIGRVITAKSLYQRVPSTILGISISLLTVTLVLAKSVIVYMNHFVVKKIQKMYTKIKSIANGNLEERLDIEGSLEFKKLSKYINIMVNSLVDYNKKMSYALSKSNIHIGTYEYGKRIKSVRYTENLPKIFSMNCSEMEQLTQNPDEFKAFLQTIKECPLIGLQDVYRHGERYIRLEEISNKEEIFGVAVDVTAETQKRIEIEKERDIDTLTGLYNRRGLDNKLTQLFSDSEKLKYSVIFMIDADGLKGINDTYGHEKGDKYLKELGQVIAGLGTKNIVASRQGGDEFVLFLYGYESEEELTLAIQSVVNTQDGSFVNIDLDKKVPLRFSLGYCIIGEDTDYQKPLMDADEKMYQNKMQRKQNKQ